MEQRRVFQFSLARLFLWILVIGAALGALCLVLRMQSEAVREAWLQGQEREIDEAGGRIIGYAKNSRLPASIDLTNTAMDCQWIKKKLPYWEYSEVRTVIVDPALAEQPDFMAVKERFPNVHFVIAAGSSERAQRGHSTY